VHHLAETNISDGYLMEYSQDILANDLEETVNKFKDHRRWYVQKSEVRFLNTKEM